MNKIKIEKEDLFNLVNSHLILIERNTKNNFLPSISYHVEVERALQRIFLENNLKDEFYNWMKYKSDMKADFIMDILDKEQIRRI